ncbi:DUF1292 domain-containing protein [Paenibacillus sp. UNC499MF]|uniref:DUF1292 domain-containing protein n=1 Tax=Paenibacillus sp. UNC499MF TaxID=1502751 RepID=UPI0008A08B08|nr:DUF1292 domain-containing protein [Paenibacillus sp. UNC499MF]SEF53226.1 Protein of unknown function [Paenibacillus sp. UNC499MF]
MSDHKHDHDQDCGCGHDHDHEHEESVFIVTDEEGKEHEMVMVYTFDSQDQLYAVLLDRNDPEADGVIFRIEEENDDAYLVNIEDEAEWERVVAVYNQIIEEENRE